jgi:hypothetical protein
MANEAKTTNEETTTAAAGAAAPGAELTVTDLNAIKQIIDVASSRGAFRAGEMAVVGQTYNKLESFLAAVSASQQPKEESKGD